MENIKSGCRDCDYKHTAISMLNPAEVELLSQNVVSVAYEKGEKLFKEQVLNAHIVYLKTGIVKLHMNISEGKDHILRIAAAPTFLGLSTIFGDAVNKYSATALEPSTACIIDITTFKKLLHNNGSFAVEIMSDICKNELSNFTWHLSQSHKQSSGRLAGALVYLAENIYKNLKIEGTISRKDIAELTGVSRENITRTISKFKEKGIIDVQKNYISILDLEELKRIFEMV